MRLIEGKVAIVTGGSRGIGRAICEAFAGQGARVLFTYVSNDAAAEETLAALRGMGAEAEAMKGDAADSGFAGSVCARAKELWGRIDILVNNAGFARDGLLMRMKDADFDDVVRTNLNGAFYMMRGAAPLMMKQRSGRVINLSSVAGVSGNPGQANYAASKAGLIGLTKSAAKELGPRGITVNAIAPGLIETDMAAALTDEQRSHIEGAIALGRLGKAEEVANLILFLATDMAGYITGQTIGIDGGMAI
ncbi:MAG: 3-oxoacyl-[acyl-carrier-protein] reductase [Clostridiales Family XIII bacterium]|jgi:3-oxoacyl-[acyl-carrier protein] reductase|nr:3-oxoacyl-[acyl-carrier-protein] reductase [Clostridiales Family XIII bacterium]